MQTPGPKAQAAQTLDRVVQVLKRHQRELREVIQGVRRDQMEILGIAYEQTHSPQEGQSATDQTAHPDPQGS